LRSDLPCFMQQESRADLPPSSLPLKADSLFPFLQEREKNKRILTIL
jgi:hypothetical protein